MISRRQAKRALEIHGDELSEFPNVVGMGVGRKDRPDRPVSETEHAVAVYVTEKKPGEELDPEGVLPGFVEIPGRGKTHKVAVRVIEIGEMQAQQTSESSGPSAFSAE